tara:strand:+ start:12958 stop:14232 length:1275 start_codon:yes stop_codon:yes gene_type:complete
MALATVTVEVAFTKGISETADDDDFTTISTDNKVREFQIVRGRQQELATTQAGRAIVVCSNVNGKLDPSNTGSGTPYYDGGTNVIPLRHIRIKATDPSTSTVYVIFRGFVERWVQEYPQEKDATTRIECVDAFKALSLAYCDGSSESQELSGLRIANLLDQAEWPNGGSAGAVSVAGYRDIDNTSANETIPAKTYGTTLDVLLQSQDIETAEIGSFFVSRSGVMTFKNRLNRISEFATISATFSDTSTSSGRVKYNGLDFSMDDHNIINRVTTTTSGGAAGTVQNDTDSQTKFGIRAKSETGLMLVAAGDATSWAEYIIGRQANPANRVQSITLRPQEQDALWAKVLPGELGNAYVVERTPAAGNAISSTVICERIIHKGRGANWVTTMELSPADTAGYWVLDDGSGTYAAFSELGNTTRLFYG